jgi:hypothetical protein
VVVAVVVAVVVPAQAEAEAVAPALEEEEEEVVVVRGARAQPERAQGQVAEVQAAVQTPVLAFQARARVARRLLE